MRTVVIGDVHGCLDELELLLREVGASKDDDLVSVGDLIGKGPDSAGVLDWARETPNLRGVLGNHELRFLEAWRRDEIPDEKAYDAETVRQLYPRYDAYMRYLDAWPMTIAEPGRLIVHAGFDPALPAAAQSPRVLANIRKLPDGTPWYERYEGDAFVVFGHWVRREILLRRNAVGIDTGCVYGGKLSAVLLPERVVVSVPARRVHKARASAWA